MEQKMDLFRCNGCDHEGHKYGCYSWMLNGHVPENCVTNINGNRDVNWQKTTDYEIKKITDKEPQYSRDFPISDYPALSKVVYDEPMTILRPTPNCSICQWQGKSDPQKLVMGPPRNGLPICSAQGGRKLTSVYGNKICKRLFEPAETIAGPE